MSTASSFSIEGARRDMGPLTEIALFAGAGGGVWASRELGHRVVCYVEIANYPRGVLKQRIADGVFDDAPIWTDVETFDGYPWRGCVDLITAGFPCPPFSVAGKQLGGADPRNKWPDTARIIREVRPRWVLLENVPGLASSGYLGRVLGDLAAGGYDAEWSCVSARAVGAPHRRDRIWVLAADACSVSGQHQQKPVAGCSGQAVADLDGSQRDVADAACQRREVWDGAVSNEARLAGAGGDSGEPRVLADAKVPRLPRGVRAGGDAAQLARPARDGAAADADSDSGRRQTLGRSSRNEGTPRHVTHRLRRSWEPEPDVGRVADGVAHWQHRLTALGNGQVPQCVIAAWLGLMDRITR